MNDLTYSKPKRLFAVTWVVVHHAVVEAEYHREAAIQAKQLPPSKTVFEDAEALTRTEEIDHAEQARVLTAQLRIK
jgi:hypothetical protein